MISIEHRKRPAIERICSCRKRNGCTHDSSLKLPSRSRIVIAQSAAGSFSASSRVLYSCGESHDDDKIVHRNIPELSALEKSAGVDLVKMTCRVCKSDRHTG
jgi:hypothetical protein